jgi:hypothetical protein
MSFFTLLLLFGLFDAIFGRNINIDIKAGWARYPLSFIPDISEFLFDQSPLLYWKYIDEMCLHSGVFESVSVGSSADALNDAQMLAFDIAHGLSPPLFRTLMDSMIGVGHYAPTLQFFQSMSKKFGNPCDGKAFVVVYPGEMIHCSVPADWNSTTSVFHDQDVAEGFFNSDISDPEWDHVFQSGELSVLGNRLAVNNVVLYGTIGLPSFCSLHRDIVSSIRLQSPSFKYNYIFLLSMTGPRLY